MAYKELKIYRLHFFEPIDGSSDFYFTSLSGAFSRFNRDQVGFSLETLKHTAPRAGKPRISKKCAVYCETLYKITRKMCNFAPGAKRLINKTSNYETAK